MLSNAFDAHCHFFDLKFLLKEVCSYAWAKFWDSYPYPKTPGTCSAVSPKVSNQKDFNQFISALVELIGALDKKSLDSFILLDNGMKKAYHNTTSYFIPLMMDIYYALDDGSRPIPVVHPKTASLAVEPPSDAVIKKFKSNLGNIHQDLVRQISQKLSNSERKDFPDQSKIKESLIQIQKISQQIQDDFILQLKQPVQKFAKDIRDDWSWGYRDELNDQIDMKTNSPVKTQVFPFLAVDPRRPGIVDFTTKNVGKDKTFRGIKLYPALGYMPDHPNLIPLYQFCDTNSIPITFHCGHGVVHTYCSHIIVKRYGHPDVDHTFAPNEHQGDYFSRPDFWEGIVSQYPNINFDFAHLGSEEDILKYHPGDTSTWTYTILNLIHKYPNVYTDISCFPNSDALKIVADILKNGVCPELPKRLMIGSDYPVELFSFLATDPYYQQMADVFNVPGLNFEDFVYHNPIAFLK